MADKICICGNPSCDSPFHAGDQVEVQWGDDWVKGEVVSDSRTRVRVRFPQPIMYTEKNITVTVTKRIFGKDAVTVTEKWVDKVLQEMNFGAAYVRFPDTKSWERS